MTRTEDILAEERAVRQALRRFEEWLEREGLDSYDPYDIWGTSYGLMARRLYYQKNPLGTLLTAPVLALEMLAPRLRGVWVRKTRYPTADAQLALAFLNLYRLERDSSQLARASGLAGDLVSSAVPGYQGLGWGYPFDWQNNKGLWKRNTPYITATPYCYEVFTGLHDTTGDERLGATAASIARFVAEDLRDTVTGPSSAAASYSPCDETRVINASAYRAFVLFDAARRLDRGDYAAKAQRNLAFILETQRPDGSWLYGLDGPQEAFIDHFHTCFVLKNLFKLNLQLQDGPVREAIRHGWEYYRKNLFEGEDQPRSFAVQPRLQLVRLETYNLAEAITLGTLLSSEIPGAFGLARRLARHVLDRYQLPDGHFVTRIYIGGVRHTLPFLRWPQSQMFYALTNLLRGLDEPADLDSHHD